MVDCLPLWLLGVTLALSYGQDSCPQLILSPHVIPSTYDTSVFVHVIFTCDPGYTRVGPHMLTCQVTGLWSDGFFGDQPPTCEAFCPTLNLTHGYVNTSSPSWHLTPGTDGFITCDAGYGPMHGYFSVYCSQQNLTSVWLPHTPTCERLCPNMDFDPNLRYDQSLKYYSGTELTFTCADDYDLNGASSMSCQNGSWTNPPPTCSRMKCPPLNASNHLLINTSNEALYIGTTASFYCEPGWSLSSSYVITCWSEGFWTDTVPQCWPNPQSINAHDSQQSSSSSSSPGWILVVGVVVGGVIGFLVLIAVAIVVIVIIVVVVMKSRNSGNQPQYSRLNVQTVDEHKLSAV